jgi:hypothetical protein
MDQRGKADARNTSRHEVVQRSVTISSTAPNVVDWLYRRAAMPSAASRIHEKL